MVERWFVIPLVRGSNPLGHPMKPILFGYKSEEEMIKEFLERRKVSEEEFNKYEVLLGVHFHYLHMIDTFHLLRNKKTMNVYSLSGYSCEVEGFCKEFNLRETTLEKELETFKEWGGAHIEWYEPEDIKKALKKLKGIINEY